MFGSFACHSGFSNLDSIRYAPGILSATSRSIRNAALGLTVPSGFTTSVTECFGPVYNGYVPSDTTLVCFGVGSTIISFDFGTVP